MANSKTDVLKAAKLLTEKGPVTKSGLKIVPYGDKVRVFGLTSGELPDVLLLGDALPSDDEDAKKATNYFTQDAIDGMLKGVVAMAESKASAEVKSPVKTAAQSS